MSKILVLDDESQVRQLCYDIFTREGHEVITISRGDQIFEVLRSQTPDLLLLDIQVPGEDGLSLLNRLPRGNEKKIPVVIFSGIITPELEKEAIEKGAIDVIHKGIGAIELKDKINKILASKHKIFGEPGDIKNNKLLVVDDDPGIRKILVTFFERKGLRVIEACNGEEAVMLVEKDHPTMILLDVTMPGMDGILTLKKIREIDPNVGVVMATGLQDEQIAKEAVELGAYGYVTKPFDMKYLEFVVLTRLVIAS